MAKTKTELLTEAAGIIAKFHQQVSEIATPGSEGHRTLVRAQQWLQEEISEEDGDSSLPQNEEPPTDDRWFAAYLKGIEAWGRIHAGRGAEAPAHPVGGLAKLIADNALAAAREQAKKSLANPGETK